MTELDFLPERIRSQRVRHRRLLRQGYLLAACAVALAAYGYVREGRLAQARAEQTILGDCAANVQRQMALRKPLEDELTQLNRRKKIDDELGSRINGRDVIAVISRMLPRTMSITDLNIEARAVQEALAPAAAADGLRPVVAKGHQKVHTVKRVVLSLTGVAANDVDVASFIGQLSACPLFEDINMGYARRTVFRGREARDFQVTCRLVR